jgi:CrcB protein
LLNAPVDDALTRSIAQLPIQLPNYQITQLPMHVLLIALGGALGSVARYGLTSAALRVAPGMAPFGVMLVNVLGSFAFGLIAGAAETRLALSIQTRLFLFVGLLGGFTTFSTYAFDGFLLLRDGHIARAMLYILGHVVAGLVAIMAGIAVAR